MENKPVCEIDEKETKRWYLNGELHREDGPAIEYSNGDMAWVINGETHRLDGPAVKFGNWATSWFINDYEVTEEITQWAEENEIDLDNLSEDDKLLIKLVWGSYGQ